MINTPLYIRNYDAISCLFHNLTRFTESFSEDLSLQDVTIRFFAGVDSKTVDFEHFLL